MLFILVLVLAGVGLGGGRVELEEDELKDASILLEMDARRVVDERQSAIATYAAVENLRNGSRRLYRNGLTGAPAGHYEIGYRLLGHLPALLHGHAKRVLVARFGTGVAASAFVQHETVREIHVVAEDEAAARRFVIGRLRRIGVEVEERAFAFGVRRLDPSRPALTVRGVAVTGLEL